MSDKKKPEKLVPTAQEVADAKARLLLFNPGHDYDKSNKEAYAEGYKDEKCPKCETVFLACIHFIRCDAEDCPMKEPGGKSLLQMMLGDEEKEKDKK